MRLAVVVQRYGADINGGAELHARYLAEHLSRHAEVRVLTTCARDYMSWKNDLPPGDDVVNGVPVERYPVSHERDLQEFKHCGRMTDQARVFINGFAQIEDQIDRIATQLGKKPVQVAQALAETEIRAAEGGAS